VAGQDADEHSTQRPPDPEQGYAIRSEFLRMGRSQNSKVKYKEDINKVGVAKRTFLHGKLPRAAAWLRTSTGRAVRVTILFDSGASHCFMHPRVREELAVTVLMTSGPAALRTANEAEVPCEGMVDNIQVAAHRYRERLSFVVADIGHDDVILGGEVLERAQAGFGPPGFWRMTVAGQELLIPLIGEHSSNQAISELRGTKKILKVLRANASNLWSGKVWRKQPEAGESDDAQDRDALAGQQGVCTTSDGDSSGRPARPASSCTSGPRRRQQERRRRNQDLTERIEHEQAELQATSDRVKQELMTEFPEVFNKDPRTCPPLRWQNHRVELEPGAKMPMPRGLKKMSKMELDETGKWVKDMVARGWIRPSLSSYAASFFFVPKPNGKGLRAVCDYRAINAITKKILPSLPLFENVITQVEGARYFSCMDLTSMFYQIRVEPSDIKNTAFRTAVGCYEFLVTPMGTTPSVGTAMNCMQQVLQHCVSLEGEELPANPRTLPPVPDQEGYPDTGEWKGFDYHTALGTYCCLFVDDILCYSRTLEDHVRHLRQLCTTLRQHHMFLNPDKCHFCQVEVTYLGNLVGRFGVRPTPDRVQALEGWPPPENVTELKSFLGLLGFCRRYIADLAQIAAPLNMLQKKGAPWVWQEAQQTAFDKLKRRCSEAPVLSMPSAEAQLVMRCDASREAMGVALYQRAEDGYLQPVEFKSKSFSESQRRLAAHDRECLALLYGLKSFRHFLMGREFDVQTDNAALSQVFTSKELSDLYSRWFWKIAEFPGLRISHRAGRKLYCADALSRRRVGVDEEPQPFFVEPGVLFKMVGDSDQVWVQMTQDAEQQYVVKVSSATGASQASTVVDAAGTKSGCVVHELGSELLQRARREWSPLYKEDKEFKTLWANDGDQRWGYFVRQELLWKNGPRGPRLCVPKGADRVEILRSVHDGSMSAHCGRDKTLAKAYAGFYWTGMYSDVVTYVDTCHRCQLSKADKRMRMGEPRALDIPQAPWEVVHMDWITGFEKSPEGFDAILVFVDSLTGMVHLKPCKKTDTAYDTAKNFVNSVVRLHGMPSTIISDRDVRLRAHFWRALQQRLGTDLRFTTAHTPNSNGKVERVNMRLGDVLRSVCQFSGKDWADNLDLCEFAINGTESKATGVSPFFANYARELKTPADLGRPTLQVPAAQEFADAMFATITHTRDALERAKRKYDVQVGKKRRPAERFAPGDRVMLATRHLNLKIESRKLTSKFVGPFEILKAPAKATNPNVVWLKTPRALRIHMPVNIKDIKRYRSRPEDLGGPEEEMPEPIVMDGQDCYEVQEFLAERLHRGRRQLLVMWKGLDLLEATWEPLANMPLGMVQEWRRMRGEMEQEFEEEETMGG
jgi:hypothetical protein